MDLTVKILSKKLFVKFNVHMTFTMGEQHPTPVAYFQPHKNGIKTVLSLSLSLALSENALSRSFKRHKSYKVYRSAYVSAFKKQFFS